MKPVLVAIFAHPDDETFGPGGSIAVYAQTHDVYVICATRGQAGENRIDGDMTNLATIREQELITASNILGVKQVIFLDYMDGTLSNSIYHEVAADIRKIIDPLKPEILMTYANNGASGHLDHVAISMITHYVFQQVDYVKKLLAFCLLKEQTDGWDDYFVYVPPGYTKDQVDLFVDVSSVWETRIKAVYEHKTQLKDVEMVIEDLMLSDKTEPFLVIEK
ncbi:MAG: PIG-L deacetylase family protein [Weeksellaceae bacterium]